MIFWIDIRKGLYKRPLGYVAEFCPFCRGFRCVRLVRVAWAEMVGGMPSENGKLLRFEANCTSCKATFYIPTLEPYRQWLAKAEQDMPRLLQLTQPDALIRHADRIEQEEALRKNPTSLAYDVRRRFLLEPFNLAGTVISEQSREIHFDCWFWGVLLAGLAAVIFLHTLLWEPAFNWNPEYGVLLLAGLDLVALMIPVFIVLGTSTRRHLRKIYLRPFRSALGPLQPTWAELAQFWPQLQGHMLSRVFKISDFCERR